MKTKVNVSVPSIAYEQSPRQLSALHCHCKNQFKPSTKHNPPHAATLRECHRDFLAKEDGQNNEVQASKHVLTKRNVVEVGQDRGCLDVGLLRALAHHCQAAPAAILAPSYQSI
jgi:hypothetical protein